MRFLHVIIAAALLTSVACRPKPIVDTGSKPDAVGGTIAGIVSSDTNAALAGRKVTAIETATGKRYEATTAINGGYTIQVPEGTYRLEVQLRDGERVSKQPDPTQVNKSDLDSGRDFVITARS